MRVYLSYGQKPTLIAPGGGVLAGIGYVIGAIFVVAEGAAAATEKFVGLKHGEVRLPKNTSEALTEGQIAYWDNTAKTVRNASLAGRFIIGTVAAAQASSDAFADVILNGVHVVAI